MYSSFKSIKLTYRVKNKAEKLAIFMPYALRLINSETVGPCDHAVCVEADDNDSGHGYAFLKTLFEFAINRSLENGPL